MKINPNIMQVMKDQYFQPGEDAAMMIRRVTDYVSKGLKIYGASDAEVKDYSDLCYEGIMRRDWIPSSPFLMNAGTGVNMLLACFVLGLKDDTRSIFNTLSDAAWIHKLGGGTGFNFSRLRSTYAKIRSTGGTSSGPISFMTLFDAEGEVIKQGGRRRAANLGTLDVSHPNIIEFITSKANRNKLTNFNISVGITDKFMMAALEGADWPLIDPDTKEIVKVVKAADILDTIAEYNWLSAEPGVIFIDTVNQDNPVSYFGRLDCTNPCGELPLLPGESCNLASINLDNFIVDREVDSDRLSQVTKVVTNFLDLALDVNQYPTEYIKKKSLLTRKLGVGIMGLHGALIQCGERYDTHSGRELGAWILNEIKNSAFDESVALAEQRGVPSGWQRSTFEKQGIKIRNMTRLTIAPTGTISMILDSSSSGIEPIFALSYNRVTKDKSYRWVNSLFEKIGREEGWFNQGLIDRIIDNNGMVTNIKSVPEYWRDLFITAREISPDDHILMQAELQEVMADENSISKTINMPEGTTKDEIKESIILAWDTKCKGVTVYREGCNRGSVLSTETKKQTDVVNDHCEDPKLNRPSFLKGVTTKIRSGCGNLWVTINPYKGKIWEVFVLSGSEGGCTANIAEISRLISLLCREGIPLDRILDQLDSTVCARAVANPKCKVRSCSHAISVVIRQFLEMYKKGELSDLEWKPEPLQKNPERVCEKCGGPLISSCGCETCGVCGYSICG